MVCACVQTAKKNMEAASPFAVVIAGRAPQPLVLASPGRWATNIENPHVVQHLAVFCTAPLPVDAAAVIYLQWPGSHDWKFIGFIQATRPSSIFRIGGERSRTGDVEMAPAPATAVLGIALEPLAPLLARAAPTQPPPKPSFTTEDLALFGRRMLESFVHFSQSFTFPVTPAPGMAPVHAVPADVIDRWYAQFQRRLELDPTFWRNTASST